jgi:large subunit ribosomal protein L6
LRRLINMSRFGKLPVLVPEGVTVNILDRELLVKGPKGELKRDLPEELKVNVGEGIVTVTAKSKSKAVSALHGTYRALIGNMIHGVTEGWEKNLEMVGTGYRAELKGDTLVLTIGYSHPVEIKAPDGITFKVEKTQITVSGIDKEKVGQVSSNIRAVRPPEPYKGKGIKYDDEVIRRKAGKAAKAQGAL